MPEAYVWPEGKLYIYPSGDASAEASYVEGVSFGAQWDWKKTVASNTGTFASRARFQLSGLLVNISVDQVLSVSDLLLAAKSGTAYNVKLELLQPGLASATYLVESAVFRSVTWDGRQGQLYKHSIELEGADFSAL